MADPAPSNGEPAPPPQDHDGDDVDRLIVVGEADEACNAACACPLRGYTMKFFVLLNTFMSAIMMFVMAVVFAPMGGNMAMIMLETGTILLMLSAMMVFYLFPPDNPFRACLRRSTLLVFRNRKWCPACTSRALKFLPVLSVPLGAGAALTAVILSSIVMNDPEVRQRAPMVRATISMWVIAFIALFPLGGARRLRAWFAEPDEE